MLTWLHVRLAIALSQPKETKRGIMPGGLSGGASLGANAPLKEGPKDHSYEIVDGEAKARVYDTPVSSWGPAVGGSSGA